MTLFLQLLVLGCATGAIYAISAIGIVLVFRSSGVINFAHGAVAMAGGYATWSLADDLNLPHVIAIPGGIAASALIGLVMYLLIMRPLGGASTLTKVIATLGAFIVLQQGILLRYGSDLKVPSTFLPQNTLHVGSVGIGADQVILIAFSIVLTAALWWVYRVTRFGIATTAVSENPRSLEALAWRVDRLRAANWALGGALGGVAGAALAPTLQLQPGSFALLIIPTLASAMLGGLRSFPLTLVGGLVLGVLQAECGHYFDVNGAGDAVPFIVIILVLVLMGRSLPLRSHINERLPRVGDGRLRPFRIALGLLVFILLVQFVLRDDIVNGMTISILAGTLLLSQVVVTGYAGQLSLAQVPIAGVGAIFAGHLVQNHGFPFLLALLCGGLIAVPIGLAIGMPSLRARGVSLAIATLGFGVAVNAVILKNNSFNGGASGGIDVGPQSVFGFSLDTILSPAHYAIFAAIVLLFLSVIVANLRRGRAGRRMLAVRANERAAASLGIHVAATKLYAFTLAAFIAGVGGVLAAFRNPVLTFTSYDPLTSITSLIQSVIGGVGYVIGALVGGVGQSGGFITAVTNIWLFDVVKYLSLILGIGLVIQVIVQPNGIADVIAHPPAKKSGRVKSWFADHTPRWIATKPRLTERDRVAVAAELEAARQHRATRFEGARLSLRNITVRFGAVTAVDGVNLDVNPGEVMSVIGPNGAGKTTLMDAVSGFVRSSGQVTLDDTIISSVPPHRRARAGMVRSFQSLELLEDMTVLDNIRCASDPTDLASFFVDLVHPKRGRLNAATAAAIDTFNLEPSLFALPGELAYGDRHLVAVARAIAAAPRVLMLDEPAAGLSEDERLELSVLIRDIATNWGVAVLLIEHDVELVRRVSDRVIALDFGKEIASGTPHEVLSNQRVVDAYLGQSREEGQREEASV